MSVVVRVDSASGSQHVAFVKGAPEVICGLCKRSFQPSEDEIKQELSYWTKQGCRVLALAYKQLEIESAVGLKRVQVERGLNFLGLLVMTSDLKKVTKPVVSELQGAAIRVVMVTGDYMDTAISVAQQCGMLHIDDDLVCVEPVHGVNDVEYRNVSNRRNYDSSQNSCRNGHVIPTVIDINSEIKSSQQVFAVTGESYQRVQNRCRAGGLGLKDKNHSTELEEILVRGVVFARMGPEQKKELVEDFQSLGYCVCMCGDGANDCGALRAADAGISLSKAEASVAAPFTSQVEDISCVPTLIREGRAALVTTFSVFKFMAAYSLIEFIAVLMLYSINSNFGDIQYFYIDLIIVLVLAFAGERTRACTDKLTKKPPQSSLVSFPVLFSLLTQTALQVTLLMLAFKYMKSESWFLPLVEVRDDENVECYENTVLFCLSSFLMINVAIAFATGEPYRKPIYTNSLFVISVVVLYALTAYITLWPADIFVYHLELKLPPSVTFRVALVEVAMFGSILSFIIDRFVVSSSCLTRMYKKVKRKTKPRYKQIETEIRRRHSCVI